MLNDFINKLHQKTITHDSSSKRLTEEELENLEEMKAHKEELQCRSYQTSKIINKPTLAEQVAKENNIEYKSSLVFVFGGPTHRFMCDERYLAFAPAINGINSGLYTHWVTKVENEYFWVINNEKAFKNITNLSEILLQMVKLYDKYIKKDIVIFPFKFALKLEGPIVRHYKGPASLVIDESTVSNLTTTSECITNLNIFLDCFMSWNFGVCIKNNPELETALLNLNEKVINLGLRHYVGPPLFIWETEYVQQYPLKTK